MKKKIEMVNELQEDILVSSYMYYNMAKSKYSDLMYDGMLNTLMHLQKRVDITKTKYYNAFIGFEGDTGFDLWYKLTEDQQNYIKSLTV